jgi:hypothetical protein
MGENTFMAFVLAALGIRCRQRLVAVSPAFLSLIYHIFGLPHR